MNEQEAIKELNTYVSDEHKLTLSRECIDLARNALEKQILLERILERLEEEPYINKGGELFLNGYNEDCLPLRKVFEIVKEEGGINA